MQPVAPPSTRLSAWQRLVYGVGDLNVAVRLSAFQWWLLPFYTDVVLLGPALAGTGRMLGLVWDAINDPLTGWLSDRTRSRLGRRRPFLLGAAVPMGLTFALLWMLPAGLGQGAAFTWFVLTYVVLDTCFTLYATPYLALGAELSDDYDERTKLSASRAFFHVVGLFVGGLVPGAILAAYGDDRAAGYAAMGIAIGAGMALVALFTGTFVRERLQREAPSADGASLRGFVRGLRTTASNRAFRVMLVTFALLSIGGGIHNMVVPYALRGWLGLGTGAVPAVIGVYVLSFVASLPLWTAAAARLGKDGALRACMVWSIVALAALPIVFEPGMSTLRMGVFLVFAGLGAGGWAVLPVAITADVVDTDELETGQRREGAYFGVWTLALKLANALAAGVVGAGLELSGYVPNTVQSPGAILGIQLLYGPIPAFFLLCGLMAFRRFPLTRARHAAVQEELARRRDATA
jgi:glycoside/pentoside/hexuronide:cation symporter, GPH family